MSNPAPGAALESANPPATAPPRMALHARAMAALVAAWWVLNDFAGLLAFAGAYFLDPLPVFVAAFVVFGAVELVCCRWVDRNWDAWLARLGPRLSERIDGFREGRFMRHVYRWAVSDSTSGIALSAMLTSGLTAVTIARSIGGRPVSSARIRAAVLAYALFVSGVFCLSGYLAGRAAQSVF